MRYIISIFIAMPSFGVFAQQVQGPERTELIEKACRQLGEAAMKDWASMETAQNIFCLQANRIPQSSLESILDAFTQECATQIGGQIPALLPRDQEFKATISKKEVLSLFANFYRPVFKRFCADQNGSAPGSRAFGRVSGSSIGGFGDLATQNQLRFSVFRNDVFGNDAFFDIRL